MKYTVEEFAKEIRKLYPGDYDDLSDKKLVELWLKKYPNDINKIDSGVKSKIEQRPDNKLYISHSIADKLPSMVKNELSKMTAQKQSEFIEEYKRKAKSVGFAYLCYFVFGLHYGYLRKWGLQLVFWITGFGILIWWILDLFRLAGLVKDYNKDVAMDVMRNLKAISN